MLPGSKGKSIKKMEASRQVIAAAWWRLLLPLKLPDQNLQNRLSWLVDIINFRIVGPMLPNSNCRYCCPFLLLLLLRDNYPTAKIAGRWSWAATAANEAPWKVAAIKPSAKDIREAEIRARLLVLPYHSVHPYTLVVPHVPSVHPEDLLHLILDLMTSHH